VRSGVSLGRTTLAARGGLEIRVTADQETEVGNQKLGTGRKNVHGVMGTFGLDVRFSQFELAQFGFRQLGFIGGPPSSYELMMVGGALLVVAALLMGIQSRMKNSLEETPFRRALISYLSRIANALERREEPNSGQNAADVLRRLVNAKSNDKVVQMPKYHSK
jgi:hypothetical protein